MEIATSECHYEMSPSLIHCSLLLLYCRALNLSAIELARGRKNGNNFAFFSFVAGEKNGSLFFFVFVTVEEVQSVLQVRIANQIHFSSSLLKLVFRDEL